MFKKKVADSDSSSYINIKLCVARRGWCKSIIVRNIYVLAPKYKILFIQLKSVHSVPYILQRKKNWTIFLFHWFDYVLCFHFRCQCSWSSKFLHRSNLNQLAYSNTVMPRITKRPRPAAPATEMATEYGGKRQKQQQPR